MKYLKDGDSTVPYSLTLTVHAMIFGVLHLQGDLERIAMASKNVSEKYYSQIQFVIDHSDPTECNIPYLQRIKASQVASESESDDANELVFWNPLSAGCFLGQVTFLKNLMLVRLVLYYLVRIRGPFNLIRICEHARRLYIL